LLSDASQPQARRARLFEVTVIAVDQGDLQAFIRDDYARMVAGLAVACGSAALAEDAVQEALARAIERTGRGERITDLKAWVAVVARNVTRSFFRRVVAERRARLRGAAAAEPNEGLSDADRIDLLAAIKALGHNQREAVALFYFADLSVEEVARVMKLHPEAVKGLLHRGRASLARSLGRPSEEREAR
jgi:RNA polymerase sigma-70 factor, ECF subfamily